MILKYTLFSLCVAHTSWAVDVCFHHFQKNDEPLWGSSVFSLPSYVQAYTLPSDTSKLTREYFDALPSKAQTLQSPAHLIEIIRDPDLRYELPEIISKDQATYIQTHITLPGQQSFANFCGARLVPFLDYVLSPPYSGDVCAVYFWEPQYHPSQHQELKCDSYVALYQDLSQGNHFYRHIKVSAYYKVEEDHYAKVKDPTSLESLRRTLLNTAQNKGISLLNRS